MTRLLSGVRGLALCSITLFTILASSAGGQEPAQKEKESKPPAGKKEPEPKQREEFIEVPTPFGIMRIPKTPAGAPAEPATQPGTTPANAPVQVHPATT